MARFEKSRPKSAKPHAAVAPARPRGSTPSSIEDTMFFPRLRRHAKWMFVFLALVFGLGFVVFGVGAGGTGIGDVLRGSGGSSGQSVSDARAQTEETPKDAQAWRDYATALETEGQTAEAIVALNTAIELAPKDDSAYRELAGLHLTRATERQQDAQLLQIRAITVEVFLRQPVQGSHAEVGQRPLDVALPQPSLQPLRDQLLGQVSHQLRQAPLESVSGRSGPGVDVREPNVRRHRCINQGELGMNLGRDFRDASCDDGEGHSGQGEIQDLKMTTGEAGV